MSSLAIDYEEPEAFGVLDRPKRYKVFYGGRGGAKSWQFAQALIIRAVEGKIRVLCARELQNSIRESVHKLLKDTIDRLKLSHLFQVEKSTIYSTTGSQFIFLGLKNDPRKVKSTEGIDIAWCEEAEAISEESWDVLIPTIREEGSEIWVSFNPALETDPTYQQFIAPHQLDLDSDGFYEDDEVYVTKVGWRDNPWFTSTLRKEMEKMKRENPNKYLHVWEGQTRAAVEGAIYGDQIKAALDAKRITSVPIETSVPVNTFWDLGRNDVTAIWFHQQVGLESRFIDYYEHRLVGLDHYARLLREKNYLYGTHYLPHDASVVDLSTNVSRESILNDMGVKPTTIVPRVQHIEDGIEQTRQAFARCYFDRERCSAGIHALQSYQYEWDEKHRTFRRNPLHNSASNGADAFRQFAQGYQENTVQRAPKRKRKRI